MAGRATVCAPGGTALTPCRPARHPGCPSRRIRDHRWPWRVGPGRRAVAGNRGATRVVLSGRRPPSAESRPGSRRWVAMSRWSPETSPSRGGRQVVPTRPRADPVAGRAARGGHAGRRSVLGMTGPTSRRRGGRRPMARKGGVRVPGPRPGLVAGVLLGGGPVRLARSGGLRDGERLDGRAAVAARTGCPRPRSTGARGESGGAADDENPVLERLSPEEGMPALEAVLASRSRRRGWRARHDPDHRLFPPRGARAFFGRCCRTTPPAWDGPVLAEPRGAGGAGGTPGSRWPNDGLGRERIDRQGPLTHSAWTRCWRCVRGGRWSATSASLPMPLLLRGASLRDLAPTRARPPVRR